MSTQNIINPNETEKKEPLSEEKCCVNCKTTKTPLWRSGPAGPKSLCNACGIRQRKKRESKDSSKVENNNDINNKKRRKCVKEENNSSRSTRTEEKREICFGNGKEGKLCGDLRRNVMALGKKVVFLQRQRSPIRRQRQRQRQNSSSGSSTYEKMGEVEQAAMLLIAMSCGSVFA